MSKKKITKIAILIACILGVCCFPDLNFGQSRDFIKKIPEGRWVLDKKSLKAVIPGCMHGRTDVIEPGHVHRRNQYLVVDDLKLAIYTTLTVKQDSIILSSTRNTVGTKYTYSNRTGIQFDSPIVPFLGGGNVFANKLYVQQRLDSRTSDPLDQIYVSYIYVLEEKE